MIHPMIRRVVHCTARVSLFLCLVTLFCGAEIAVAAGVGDQVTLEARTRAGVPLHSEPRGTHDFQRVPDGTKATVLALAQDGRWLKLALPDGRTGWVTSSYLGGMPEVPSTGTSRAAKPPLRIEEGVVERVADGDTITVITPNQTKLRIRLWGIDAPETPKGTKFPGQPYGKEAEVYLKQLVAGKQVKVEIFGVDRYKRLLSTIFIDGKDINLAMIEGGLAEVYRGPESGNPYKPQYQAADEVARSARKGMWVLGDQYESPGPTASESASVRRNRGALKPRDSYERITGSTTTRVTHQHPHGCPLRRHDPGESGYARHMLPPAPGGSGVSHHALGPEP